MEEKKEVVEKKPSLPARVSGKGGKPVGFEEVDIQQDIILPRIAILQTTSQLVIDEKGKLGDLADSISKELFGKEFNFIPLYCFKTRCKFILDKGLVCQSRNALNCTMSTDGIHHVGGNCLDCEDGQWPEAGGGPACSLVYNFPALNPGSLDAFPIAVSLMKTSSKAGRKLISLAMRTGEDFFARKYKLYTIKTSNEKGTFAVADVELIGRTSDEEYAIAKKWFSNLRARIVEVDLEQEAPNFES